MFEHLVDLVTTALYKILKGAKLTFKELQSVLLGIHEFLTLLL